MNDDFDDLDRAIFALPLEAPPPDLRASILRATSGAPTPALSALLFTRNEIVGIGLALAIAAWLVLAAIADHRFATTVTTEAYAVLRELTEPTTLAWTTFGGAIAAALTLTNLSPLRRGIRKS